MSQQMQRLFSPYQINPFDINPLRDLVAGFFDFDIVNRPDAPKLFLSATNVRSGLAKVSVQPGHVRGYGDGLGVPSVSVQGRRDRWRGLWDGGYMGNPPLFPLIDETDERDLVLVQIDPIRREELPRTAYEIENRLNEITFNASLIKELRAAST